MSAQPSVAAMAAGTATFSARAFAAALLDPERPLPAGLTTWNGSDPAARFGVYRNNVMHSLVEALATTFDVVRQLIGDECFRATASVFVRQFPLDSPILAQYGEHFAEFLAGFAPLAALPCLPDMARLEFCRVQAFHAADADPLNHAALKSLWAEPSALENTRLILHPSLHVMRFKEPVTSIWSAHQGLGDLAAGSLAGPEAALVLREHDDAAVFKIGHASAYFMQGLQQGLTLGESMNNTLDTNFPDQSALDLAATLGLLLHHPALCGFTSSESRT